MIGRSSTVILVALALLAGCGGKQRREEEPVRVRNRPAPEPEKPAPARPDGVDPIAPAPAPPPPPPAPAPTSSGEGEPTIAPLEARPSWLRGPGVGSAPYRSGDDFTAARSAAETKAGGSAVLIWHDEASGVLYIRR